MSLEFYKPNMSKRIFLSSDAHYAHLNYCKGVSKWSDISSCRDFPDQFIMSDILVQNINDYVGIDDTLIHLGDWSFGGKDRIIEFRDRIRCENIVHILGNHDHHIRAKQEYQDLFTWVGDYLEFRYKGTLVCCFHYPVASWNEIGKGSVMLHGHCHHSLPEYPGRRADVGIDGPYYDFRPQPLDNIMRDLLAKPIIEVDHHGPNTN